MEQTKRGVVYILTNPAFQSWVKIGYTENLENRLNELNRSECVPYSFRAYAICEVDKRLADKDIHRIFDKINPELRSRDTHVNGKERLREFFKLSPEDAYEVLWSMANFISSTDRVKRIEPTPTEKVSETEATIVRKTEVLRTEFWRAFSDYYKAKDDFFNSVNLADNFTWSCRTLKGSEYIFWVTNNSVDVRLKAKQDLFSKLYAKKAEIDKLFTVQPAWDSERLEVKFERTDLNINERGTWQTIFEFMANTMIALKNYVANEK